VGVGQPQGKKSKRPLGRGRGLVVKVGRSKGEKEQQTGKKSGEGKKGKSKTARPSRGGWGEGGGGSGRKRERGRADRLPRVGVIVGGGFFVQGKTNTGAWPLRRTKRKFEKGRENKGSARGLEGGERKNVP